ncbi:MAG: alpha/beta fold hydrolase [Patescibacteria group bacterium]
MKQVCVIHGGNAFESKSDFIANLKATELDYDRLLYHPRWNNWLGETLTDFEVLLPTMPNASSAEYDEWSLYFSKILPFLKPNAVLVGHSLGGIFLAKYLNEHSNSLHFKKVILIAPPFRDETDESLASFRLPQNMSDLSSAADEFILFHSRDDFVVPFEETNKYLAILPHARATFFEDRGHINTPTFPELLDEIKK